MPAGTQSKLRYPCARKIGAGVPGSTGRVRSGSQRSAGAPQYRPMQDWAASNDRVSPATVTWVDAIASPRSAQEVHANAEPYRSGPA